MAYSWRNAGSLGWSFPMLKYRYIFQIKYTEAIFSDITEITVMVLNYQNAHCSLRKEIILLLITIFGTLSFPIAIRTRCGYLRMNHWSRIGLSVYCTSVFSIISILSTASPSDLNLIYPHCNAFEAPLLPAEQAITLSRWNQANGEQFNIVCQRWFQFLYE